MRVPQLPTISGSPGSTDYIPISDSSADRKIGFTALSDAVNAGAAKHYSIPYQQSTVNFSEAFVFYPVGNTGLSLTAGKWLVFGNFMSASSDVGRQELVMISDDPSGWIARRNMIRDASDTSADSHYAVVIFAVTLTETKVFKPFIMSSAAGKSSNVYAFVNAIQIH